MKSSFATVLGETGELPSAEITVISSWLMFGHQPLLIEVLTRQFKTTLRILKQVGAVNHFTC